MGFPGADSPPFTMFSAPSSVIVRISSSPQLAIWLCWNILPFTLPLGGVSMGFPGADSPPFTMFSAPSSVLVRISSPPQLAT